MTALAKPLQDRGVFWSAIACALGFGGFLAWSIVTPLAEGVTASGQIVVRDDRKQVQHFEGGIIAALFVREGDVVRAGQILVELEPLQSEAARDELAQELAVQTASLERLTALRGGTERPDFAGLAAVDIDEAIRADIQRRQLALYEQQKAAHEASIDLLSTRRRTLQGRADDLRGQIAATRDALSSGQDDLALRRQLLSERLETIGNVSAIAREVSRLEADLSRLLGARNEAVSGIEEASDELRRAEADLLERTGREVVEAQGRALVAAERLRGTEDRLARTTIRAPISGEVLNLNFATVGGVVRQGEPIMEIVPSGGALIATVRLAPTDRDSVTPGQQVEAQLTAYKSFVPSARLDGEVIGVSADLIEDPVTATYYYEARIMLDESGLDPADRIEVIPGMPVDAYIASGRSRTFMSYMLEPITETVKRGTRMN